jgi:hypothetical protein
MNKREKRKFDKQIGDSLWEIVNLAIEQSGGRLRLAIHEESESEKIKLDASQFLKLDGKRLGKDIKMYIFFGAASLGWEATLAHFLEEVVLPLKTVLPESYKKSAEKLEKLGELIYSEETLDAWRECFKNTGKADIK